MLRWLYLDSVMVLWVQGDIGAASMAGRDELCAVLTTHRVEDVPWTGAVGVAQGK